MKTFLDPANADVNSDVLRKVDSDFAERFPMKILLVEDVEITIRVVAAMLRGIGYSPLIARHGLQAVETYSQEFPDFIIMDIQMPEMDGIEATRRIRSLEQTERLKKSFITALTAANDSEHRPQCFAAGMDEYMRKPIQKSRLCKALMTAFQAIH